MKGCPICAVRRWWLACYTCERRRCNTQHTMKEIIGAVVSKMETGNTTLLERFDISKTTTV